MGADQTKTFGQLVRQARTDVPMPLRELARQIEVAPSYINDIEHDRRIPSEAVVRKICEALPDLDVDQMLAVAGRIGERAEQYMKDNPTAGVLFRKVSDYDLGERELQQLLSQAEQLAKKGAKPKKK